jgi:hypothetical protein
MHEGELQIGNAVARSGSETFLQRLGLDPVLTELGVKGGNDPVATSRESLSSFQADLSRTFLLMLDAKTSLYELYPSLVGQLDILRQRGYLSHWDGQSVIRRPVTIFVSGEDFPESDCVDHSYSDVFWSIVPGSRVMMSDFTKDGLRDLVPVCIG